MNNHKPYNEMNREELEGEKDNLEIFLSEHPDCSDAPLAREKLAQVKDMLKNEPYFPVSQVISVDELDVLRNQQDGQIIFIGDFELEDKIIELALPDSCNDDLGEE